MPWEWVAPAATGAVAAAGIAGTYFASGRQQKATIAAAREDRQWQQSARSYDSLLEYVSQVNAWTERVFPIITSPIADYAIPPMEPLPDRHHADALNVYWSTAVAALMTDWRAELDRLVAVGIRWQALRSSAPGHVQPPFDEGALILQLPERKLAIAAVDQRLRDRIRAELRGSNKGTTRGSKASLGEAPAPVRHRHRREPS